MNTNSACAANNFYGDILDLLASGNVETLIGGAYAHEHYTGISRDTKDLDIFLRERDLATAMARLREAGYRPEIKFTHWLGKVYDRHSPGFVDIIFNSGNGLCKVDDSWFDHAPPGTVFGRAARFCPVEETLWQKSFIMERERYDGADIAHLLRAQSHAINWQRLLRRFDGHWRVLLSYLTLFGYIYPAERSRIPAWVLRRLLELALGEIGENAPGPPVCAGTFLSRSQFQVDIDLWNYRDARIPTVMSHEAVRTWTKAGEEERSQAAEKLGRNGSAG